MNYDDYDDVPVRRGKNKRKNTRNFCRGNPKHPHTYSYKAKFVWSWSEIMAEYCTRCGKESRTFRVVTGTVPEWYRKWRMKW
jgi:hypothetical protein